MQIIVVLGFLRNMLVLNSSMRQQDINGEKDTNWVLSCLTTHPEESSYECTLTFYYSYVELNVFTLTFIKCLHTKLHTN